MNKVLKWILIVLGGVLGLVVLAAIVLYFIGSAQLNKTYDIQAEAIPIPTGEAALARGEHLTVVALCTECHGQNLGGDLLFDDPTAATIYAPNITGLGATHSDADLVRAIRHGLDKDGRQLIIMPADLYVHLSAEDLGALIAYLKTLPPLDNDVPEPKVTLIGRILLAAGMFGKVFPAATIDHEQPFPSMPEIGPSSDYGAYLAQPLCTSCHGQDLAGGIFDPEAPPAPNLTPGDELGDWSEAEFIQTMRSGVSPEGDTLDPEIMPWPSFAQLSDDELTGLWMYLQSLPPQESGS